MKIYQTVWFKDFRRTGLLSELVKGGFDGFELSLDYPLCVYDVEAVGKLRDLLDSGLELAIHLPWREMYLASPVEEVREVSLRYVIRCLTYIGKLNPEYAVLHLVSDQAVCSDNPELCISASVKSLEVVGKVASDLGIELLVETTRNYCCGGLEQIVSYLDMGVGVCLDIPHAIERYSRLRRRPLKLDEVMSEAPPRALEAVVSVHLHGYSMSGHHVVNYHVDPSRELVDEYLNVLNKGVLKPKYTVLETFYSSSLGRPIRFNELRWCVDELRKSSRRDR